ncbi:putative membrane protein [Escherichia coli 4-203-08_S1_C1]|nr:putative membrane protein [Escherichia coli 2-011-08_S3_C2]KDU59801.1 putative membrane protein [Escherichia coli 4-203-08_S1_C1]KEK90699.1 putative membrane protein [Escherichia coli 4-203-08_S1_C2]
MARPWEVVVPVLLLVAVANYIFIYFTGTFSVVPVKYILFV